MAKFMTAYDFREQSFLVKKQSLKGDFFSLYICSMSLRKI